MKEEGNKEIKGTKMIEERTTERTKKEKNEEAKKELKKGHRHTDRQRDRHTKELEVLQRNNVRGRVNQRTTNRQPVLSYRRRRSHAKGATREDSSQRNQDVSKDHSGDSIYHTIDQTGTTKGQQGVSQVRVDQLLQYRNMQE